MANGRVVQVLYHGKMVVLGCPPGGCCRHCAGGWPGTTMSGESLVDAARKGVLDPEKLGCPTTQEHGKIAVELFAPES